MQRYIRYPGYHLSRKTLQMTLSGLLVTVLLLGAIRPSTQTKAQDGTSIRFYGSGTADSDRVKIPLGPIDLNGRITTSYPVNLSNSFTIEFWMKASAADNTAPTCPDGWYTGNIIIDRDVFGAGDYGDYGIAICNRRLVVGISIGNDDRLLTGSAIVTDSMWHHIAVTRSDSGQIRLFVDGQLDGSLNGPIGRIDYRINRPTTYPNSDPYLVLGAEKYDYPGSRYYNGWLDDLRLSRVARYTNTFPRPTTPHAVDDDTVALYRFDEGSGTFIGDSAAGSISNGILNPRPGGAAQHWSSDTPFTPEMTPTLTATHTPSHTPTLTVTSAPSHTPTLTVTSAPSHTPTL
ncbi:LamG domain-containing protein, partial [Chloroflexus sp.]|uniref:LamG domain-containing protein n=1 Tax=Chloroflexus sp. TaxID=1904827 RepID=UPI002FDB1020